MLQAEKCHLKRATVNTFCEHVLDKSCKASYFSVFWMPSTQPRLSVWPRTATMKIRPSRTTQRVSEGLLFKREFVMSKNFNPAVLVWASGKAGQSVGAGECWDLANSALLKAWAGTSSDFDPRPSEAGLDRLVPVAEGQKLAGQVSLLQQPGTHFIHRSAPDGQVQGAQRAIAPGFVPCHGKLAQ